MVQAGLYVGRGVAAPVVMPENSLGTDKREESTPQYCDLGQEKNESCTTAASPLFRVKAKQFLFGLFALTDLAPVVGGLAQRDAYLYSSK